MTERQAKKIAEAIETESRNQCIEHLGYVPETWYTGGSSHNDDRLSAYPEKRGNVWTVVVNDGCTYEEFKGTLDQVPDFVSDWLSALWGDGYAV